MTRILRLAALCVAVFLSIATALAAEFTPAQRAEIVQILRDALKQDPSILRDAVAGNAKGDVTIVEFFDTRCPYCRKLEPTMADFLARDHGVRLVYKDLPILGPASVLGSKALLAAQKQGGYEKLRDAIMLAPPDTTKAMIQADAQKLGLDWKRLERDMDDPAITVRIQSNLKLAHDLGIEGTPAMVIGGTLIPGAIDIADLAKAVASERAAK
jgi:protein-disulfide isomerase